MGDRRRNASVHTRNSSVQDCRVLSHLDSRSGGRPRDSSSALCGPRVRFAYRGTGNAEYEEVVPGEFSAGAQSLKAMADIKRIEKEINTFEGFAVVIRSSSGRAGGNSSTKARGYKRRHQTARENHTVNDWKRLRFEPDYPDFAADVLLGDGRMAAGKTRLASVRNSYTARTKYRRSHRVQAQPAGGRRSRGRIGRGRLWRSQPGRTRRSSREDARGKVLVVFRTTRDGEGLSPIPARQAKHTRSGAIRQRSRDGREGSYVPVADSCHG